MRVPRGVAGRRTNDEVHVALPDPGLLVHLLVGDGQWPQRLGRHLPRIAHHRQFTAPGTDHFAVHEHDVAEVDVGLPRLQGLFADTCEADHHLQLGAVAVLQRREAQLSRVTGEHHAPRDADDLTAPGVGGQFGVGGADLSQCVGALHRNRVGVAPLGEQAFSFRLPDPELFGKISLTHVVPA